MTAQTFQPIEARPAPVNTEGLVPWIRNNLFANAMTSIGTVLIGGLLLWFLPQLLNWAVFKAAWRPNADACRVEGVGACWGVWWLKNTASSCSVATRWKSSGARCWPRS
jgi:general L-amino acid transport system permease protein